MAGMFYSLQEAADRLSTTREHVEDLVRQGRLREFRDGSNVLFKADEVESLMSDTTIMAARAASSDERGQQDEEAQEDQQKQQADIDEISLVPEASEDTTAAGDLTGADTLATGQGTDVLGETDTDYPVTEDTMGETKAAAEELSLASSSGEASLEEIEEDVNLDTFGSGSGLLDLSLQADDTSLGSILDEIYTAEGEGGPEPSEGSEAEVAAEPTETLGEEEFAAPEPVVEAVAVAPAYVEPGPDSLSNALGIMLFLPLLAIFYTAILAVAGFGDLMPAVLEKIRAQYLSLYIMGGLLVAALAMFGVVYMIGEGGSSTGKKPKAKKAKKAKKPKKSKS